ncbi:hypothetical protein [Nocardioides sp. Leaf285]|uniref:hypothetical protein n=1 Tax=Nocardioides sp. Leaf285 TaxID=1736322 RepID=UPI000702B4F5|nr:hypothetical protein [Nocardioides sp. Leaf285]KQP63587.1 hypothetical protein ASF47_16220 [Nocardioides sp. Leaf285]
MPTAASSTERWPGSGPPRRPGAAARWRAAPADAWQAVVDTGHLVAFRAGTVRSRGVLVGLAATFVALTAAAAVVPAWTPGAGPGEGRSLDVLLLLPTAMAGFLLLALVSAVVSGGGRELLARDPAAVHPVSPTTDHLGALVLAPLNIAWLLQAWTLLGSTAYAVGPAGGGADLAAAQVGMLLWLALATALAQVVAWSLEGLRRLRGGVLAVRLLGLGVLAAGLALQATGRLVPALDRGPTVPVLGGLVGGPGPRWGLTVAGLLVATLLAVALGAVPAHLAARRHPRDEQGSETEHHEARPLARWPLTALVRTDRASVWRAVPMRRGLLVLAVGPGLVALLGGLRWDTMTVLPGLVASGGALLFGVNAWCLDGRGGRWRESLPVDPATVFDARAWVLAEFLLAASLLTTAIAAVRAGVPSAAELAAITATLAVVTVQVVAAAMRWSLAHPHAVDLRSARATPAPPLGMVGYSTRLAVSTTVTGLVFSGLSRAEGWALPVLCAVPFLAWSSWRLLRTRRRWLDPVERARVVLTVTA